MSEKVIGYLLLTIGLFVIFFSALNVYQVFTSQAQPVSLFNFPPVTMNLAIDPRMPAIKQEILPAASLNQSANVAAHLFLMGFVVSVGYRVASLGIQLVRTISVVIKEKTSTSAGK